MSQDFIKIGQITTTQGHKGEVRVYPLTDDITRFKELTRVRCRINTEIKWLTINNVRYNKNLVILRFNEIGNMNEAQLLKSAYLEIRKEDLLPLEEDHYYIFELLDLEVWTDKNEFLGIIKDVQPTGSNDVYHVENPKSNKVILIPALRHVVNEINLEQGKMVIIPLPGLLD